MILLVYIVVIFFLLTVIDRKYTSHKPSSRIIFWTLMVTIYFLPVFIKNINLPDFKSGVIWLLGAITLVPYYIGIIFISIRSILKIRT